MASQPQNLRDVAAGDPDPEVTEKAQRRVFTAAYKRSILEQAENCKQPGEIGALLRREGLYSSHLGKWRKQFRAGELLDQKRGPKPEPESTKRIQQLEREVARLQRKLENAELIIDVQKKLSQLLSKDPTSEKS